METVPKWVCPATGTSYDLGDRALWLRGMPPTSPAAAELLGRDVAMTIRQVEVPAEKPEEASSDS